MKDTRFAYSVAYMRTLENKMLEQSDIDSMLAADHFAGAVKYLADRGYGDGVLPEGKRGIDDMLKAELEKAWEEIREACPKGAPVDVLLYQNDFQNLKTILKAVFGNEPWEGLMLYPVTVEPELIHRAVSENNMEILPPLLKKSAEEAYALLAATGDGRRAEVLVDKAAFAAMEAEAKKAKNPFLLKWVNFWALLSNLKIAVRAAREQRETAFIRESMLPGGEIDADILAAAAAQGTAAVLAVLSENGYGDAAQAAERPMSDFEKWADNALMEYVKDAKNRSFGFEPLMAFLFGKKAEIQAVRIVLYGLLNHIPKNVLKERLREMYV